MSGGKGESSTSSPYAGILAAIAQSVNAEVDPVRQQFLSQLSQVLSGNEYTGGAIPLIKSGVSAARQAGASALESAQGFLAQTGVARSPFAAAVMSMVSQGTNAAIGEVPTQVATGMLGQVSSAASGFTQSSMSGLASAIQGNQRSSQSNFGFNIGDLIPSNW